AHEVRAAEKILRFDVRLPAARNPDVDRLDGKGKAAWRDANDLERPPIDTYAAANHARVRSELIAPEAVGNDDCMREAIDRPCFVRREEASPLRMHPQHVEEIARNARRLQDARRSFAGERRHARAIEEHRDILKGI